MSQNSDKSHPSDSPDINQVSDLNQIIPDEANVTKQVLLLERNRLLALLDGIDDVIYVADPNTYELLHVNQAVTNTWGDNVIGKKCHKVLQDRDEPCPFCSNHLIFGEYFGKTYVWEFQNEVNKNWYRLADKAIEWYDGRMVRFELAADITKLKTTEKELRHRTLSLERSNRELEQFAYVASHDLQEPLRSVSGFLQLLERRYDEILDETAKGYIARSTAAAERMRELISSLLTYSRVNTKGNPFEPTNLNRILMIAIANIQVLVEESGATITNDTLPTVNADSFQIIQLFQNMITNAIKFKGKEKPAIHFGVTENADEYVLSVQDNGIGIDKQYSDRIFVIFQRLHTRSEIPGTGIGLSISKRIIERHGGNIWFESELGNGTTFYFTIPK